VNKYASHALTTERERTFFIIVVHTADVGLHSRRQPTVMGWLRSVGSIKLQVSFAEHRLFYRALLQKRPII